MGSKDNGKDKPRYLQHLSRKDDGLFARKLRKLKKRSAKVKIRIVANFDDRLDACREEVRLISLYGRLNDGGTLYNVASGGDGGNTYNGRRFYHDPVSMQEGLYQDGDQPDNWIRGRPSVAAITLGKSNFYNVKTGKIKRLIDGRGLGKSWRKGLPPDKGYGPCGKKIYHDKSGKMLWLHKDETPPKGFKPGRSNQGSTSGRQAYHDPKTRRAVFVEQGMKIPKGMIKGLPMREGHQIRIGDAIYSSYTQACKELNTSRFLLEKNYTVERISL
jgi:hypothetical protein